MHIKFWAENLKGSLERPRRSWEVNIIMNLREVGWGVADWIHMAQDMDEWRIPVITVMNFRFHKRRQGIS
jgi:uncharacterized protein YebE (UPF0316 family)